MLDIFCMEIIFGLRIWVVCQGNNNIKHLLQLAPSTWAFCQRWEFPGPISLGFLRKKKMAKFSPLVPVGSVYGMWIVECWAGLATFFPWSIWIRNIFKWMMSFKRSLRMPVSVTRGGICFTVDICCYVWILKNNTQFEREKEGKVTSGDHNSLCGGEGNCWSQSSERCTLFPPK